MVCFYGGALWVVCVGVEGVEVCADALYGCEVLVLLVQEEVQDDRQRTCTAPAPVSRVLLVTLSGSPTVLLDTGI